MQDGHSRSNTPVKICNATSPMLEFNNSYRYFGVNFSNKIHHDPSQLFLEMAEPKNLYVYHGNGSMHI